MGYNRMLLVCRVCYKEGLKDRLLDAVPDGLPLPAQAVHQVAVHHLSADRLYSSPHHIKNTIEQKRERILAPQHQHVSTHD